MGAGPVALIDTDPQGSLAAWWNERRSDAPALVSTSLAQLPADVERLRLAGCRLVVIDTPPAMNMAIQRVINLAELVVIPVRRSPHDLRAVAGTLEMAERAQCRLVFVLNAVNMRARITSDAVIALSQHGSVAPVFIQQRTDFATSMIDGRTVCELEPEAARPWKSRSCGNILRPSWKKQEAPTRLSPTSRTWLRSARRVVGRR